VQVYPKSSCQEVDALIVQELDKVRTTIAELTLLEQTLYTLVTSGLNDRVGDCQVLKNLQQANKLSVVLFLVSGVLVD
jgi:hypothetical protein